ncbi:MAG: hypothetical protein K0S08_1492, partial [Gammaproteobacteria bacterium]|nr:hypothetical protein [Gammaproteobacteria bacterium]
MKFIAGWAKRYARGFFYRFGGHVASAPLPTLQRVPTI